MNSVMLMRFGCGHGFWHVPRGQCDLTTFKLLMGRSSVSIHFQPSPCSLLCTAPLMVLEAILNLLGVAKKNGHTCVHGVGPNTSLDRSPRSKRVQHRRKPPDTMSTSVGAGNASHAAA